MRRSSAMGLAAAMGVMVGMAMAEPAPAPLPDPILTRQPSFALPFLMDGPSRSQAGAAKVELFVSTDQGTQWRLHGTVAPGQKRFIFHAGQDGEYWFALRTVDRAGQADPPRIETPGLCVIVDTTAPQLAMRADQAPTGQVTARWTLAERHPTSDPPRVEHRIAPNGPWQIVEPIEFRPSNDPRQAGGQVSWQVAPETPVFEVRLTVHDQAGNTAVIHAPIRRAAAELIGPTNTQAAVPSGPRFVDRRPLAEPQSAGVIDSPSSSWTIDRPFIPPPGQPGR
ncbi:MAG: hypothetical protein JW818_23535 [Pirellulales bacterium]|nr:hypothetical protein [Pirellulales bacterium]